MHVVAAELPAAAAPWRDQPVVAVVTVTSEQLIEALRTKAAQYLGPEADPLLALRIVGDRQLVVADDRLLRAGHEQVTVLAELAGFTDGDPAIARLTVPYMVLQTHYYLLDCAVDAQATDASSLLALTDLLLLFTVLVDEELDRQLAPPARAAARQRLARRLAERAQALRLEAARRESWNSPDETDEAVAIARSNSVLLAYELLCALNLREPDPAVQAALADLVHYLQLGDDLADWEQDLATGNRTALLRECAARLEPDRRDNPEEIADELLLGGFYELYAARLVRGFERVAAELRGIPHVRSEKAQAYLTRAQANALTLLTGVVRAKLEHFGDDVRQGG